MRVVGLVEGLVEGLGMSNVRSTVDGSEVVSSARHGSGGANAGLGGVTRLGEEGCEPGARTLVL